METRIRRYFALRRLNQGASSDLTSMGDENRPKRSSKRLGLALTTTPARTEARSKWRVKATASTDSLTLKSSPYESTQLGKPPVWGGTPVLGNGPVRLQHNVRLSSGELLVAEQSNEQNLEDIKRGDYTVARKEHKHSSHPRKATTLGTSPKPLSISAPREPELRSLPQTPFLRNDSAFENSPSSFAPSTGDIRVRDFSHFSTHRSTSSLPLDYSHFSESRSSQRASGVGNDNEGNVLIQALWKAEYNQLLSIQHQNHSTIPQLPPRFEEDYRPSSRDVPYIEGHCSPDLQAYHHFPNVKDFSFTDESSTYSSPNDNSGTSSNRTDSTCTGRTSFQRDAPGTRDDVRRMVEDMRAMYLSAIESKSTKSSPTSFHPAVTTRASVGPTTPPQRTSASRPTQKSWHAGSSTNSTSRSKPHKKKKLTSTTTGAKLSQPSETTFSPQTSPIQPPLTRADSMTLGSLLGAAPKQNKTPTSVSQTTKSNQPRPPAVDIDAAFVRNDSDFQNMI